MADASARDAQHGVDGSHPSSGPTPRPGTFLAQVVAELRKVVRPTQRELVTYTLVVLVFVAVIMAYVFGLDRLFGWLVSLVFGG